MYRGREGVRELWRELYAAFAEIHVAFPEIRDLGERIVAIGRIRARGKESGAETESPFAYLVRVKNSKAIWVGTYLEPDQALKAAGLRE